MIQFSAQTTLLDVDSAGLGYRSRTLDELRGLGVAESDLLAAVKVHLANAIDVTAESLRARLMTPGVGQAMEYQEAQAQAQAALKASSSATAVKYPMLAASIGIDVDPSTGEKATDVLGVARSVDAARSAWLLIGAHIRATRLAAKTAIAAAGDIAAATAAYNAADWTLPAT